MKIDINPKLFPYLSAQAQEKGKTTTEYINDILNQVSEKIIHQVNFEITIDNKIKSSLAIIQKAYQDIGKDNISLAWTGGKDSTLILWLVRKYIKKHKLPYPKIVFIDEGNVFEEITDFAQDLSKKWKFNYEVIKNSDVSNIAGKVGGKVLISKLNKRNQEEIKRLKIKKRSFIFEPESFIGNHLMKTVALNMFLEKSGYKALITGIRWDEQGARGNERYFSPRSGHLIPDHTRIHPILHFTETDIWEAIHKYKIPYCELYKEGYRSLGAKGTTKKVSDKPAWEQDLKNTTEREGRNQDKEKIMERLRNLGYM